MSCDMPSDDPSTGCKPVPHSKNKLAGLFIVLDGPDGAGKTTQQTMLADRLTQAGVDVVCCRDPGGTEIGDRIRGVLLNFDLSQMDCRCETLLFMASRAQLCAEVIRPALKAGKTVISDRYVSATCAYQGAAGFDPRAVIDLARHATGDPQQSVPQQSDPTRSEPPRSDHPRSGLWPALTIILDVPTQVSFSRIGRSTGRGKPRNSNAGQARLFDDAVHDAMELRCAQYHARVRTNFLELADYYPGCIVQVDGSADPQLVHECVFKAVQDHVASS